MKLAILTQPLGHNYGGLLQAYALQRFLISKGYDVETIDRRSLPGTKKELRKVVTSVAKLLLGRIRIYPTAARENKVFQNLHCFRDTEMRISPLVTSTEQLKEYFGSEGFDGVIVGSDQVWRPKYSPCIENYFFDFLEDNKSILKVSYAASFGVDQWEFSEEESKVCSRLAKLFDSISVREMSAVDMCADRLGVSAKLVSDPTMLINKEDYLGVIGTTSVNGRGKILNYVLDQSSEKQEIVQGVGKRLSMETFSVKPESGLGAVTRETFNDCIYPGIEHWLAGFKEADYVITDSFHGTVFSIIFNKPFISVGNLARGLSRFESLLGTFGLEERLVTSAAQLDSMDLEWKYSWAAINDIKNEFSRSSGEFLLSALDGHKNGK